MASSELQWRLDGQAPAGAAAVLARLDLKLALGAGRVRCRSSNLSFGDDMTRPAAVRWSRRRMRNGGKETRLYIRRDHGPTLVIDAVVVEAVAAPSFDISAGDPAIQAIVRAAAAEFPKLLSLGGYVCKFVSGTTTPSQHCRFGPVNDGCNAWDLALKRRGVYSVRLMWRLAHWLANHADALRIDTVIFRDRIWTPSAGWHAYGGVFHSTHVHVNPRERADLACSPS